MNTKNILCIGGFGFIGNNILNYYFNNIINNSYKIKFYIIGRSPVHNINKNINYFFAPDYDKKYIFTLMEKFKIEEVFHFFSSTFPSTSNTKIKENISNDLFLTIDILENMRDLGVKKITYISSAGTIYNNNEKYIYQEDQFASFKNSYAIVKKSIEEYIRLYNHLYGISFLILRVSNPFGHYHTNDKNGFINISLRKIINKQNLVIWGSGNLSKDYIYSIDLAKIFWDLYFKQINNEIINISSGEIFSINDILSIFKKLKLNFNCEYYEDRDFDTAYSFIDISKLKNLFDYKYTPIEEAIWNTYLHEIETQRNK